MKSRLTFSPAGQDVAEVGDSVLRVVVGDARALPLPEADLVPEIPCPPGSGSRLWLRRVPTPLLTPAAHPRQLGQVWKRNCPPWSPARGCALKLGEKWDPLVVCLIFDILLVLNNHMTKMNISTHKNTRKCATVSHVTFYTFITIWFKIMNTLGGSREEWP